MIRIDVFNRYGCIEERISVAEQTLTVEWLEPTSRYTFRPFFGVCSIDHKPVCCGYSGRLEIYAE